MRWFVAVAILVAVTAGAADAQMHNPSAPSTVPDGACGVEPMAMPGAAAGPVMAGGMRMCPMMRGGCGSMGAGSASGTPSMPMVMPQPGESPRAVQLRGEMLKEIGDVLIKYSKAMEGIR